MKNLIYLNKDGVMCKIGNDNIANKDIPIVCFIYDDSTNGDETLVRLLEDRGLIATFCPIGGLPITHNANWANKMKVWMQNGHGTLAHGEAAGVGLPYGGISTFTDAQNKLALETENNWMDYYGFPRKGIAYFNRMDINPHTMSIVQKYYDFGFMFYDETMPAISTPQNSRYALNRYSTDYLGFITNAKNYLHQAIGKNVICAFGGHMNTTANTASKLQEFTEFLDYVKFLVDNKLVISMNAEDAVNTMYGRANAVNVISEQYGKLKDFEGSIVFNPSEGQNCIINGVHKMCTDSGQCAIYKITNSGTATSGGFTLTIDGEEDVTISTTSASTLDSIFASISSNIFKNTTIIKDDSTIIIKKDYAGICAVPTISNNTSGLTFTIDTVISGAKPVFV